MKFKGFILGVLICHTCLLSAQFIVDAELRPRFEYRHGFGTIFPVDTDPAAFVSQRTRVNFSFSNERFNFFVTGQDVRVWGDTPQLSSTSNNGFNLHQAWGEVFLNKKLSLKFGRQELAYDDQRFLGNVGWAQQARSHDLALLKLRSNGFKLDFGLAFNQDGQALTGTALNTKTYKSIQYLWLNKSFKSSVVSLLLLNNGEQFIDETNEENNETRYSQTIGTHYKYHKNKFIGTANIYFQFGKDLFNNTFSASLIGIEGRYIFSKHVSVVLGGEQQSGNDFGSINSNKNRAFTPFYGTNHKFNGLMDYFYVGNHKNNVGLMDLYLKSNFTINNKSSLSISTHNFFSSAKIANHNSKQLGVEVDLVYNYKLYDDVNLKIGYSQMFDNEGLRIIKNNFNKTNNNWGWVMLTLKPILYKHS